jgi:trk system potassium uptake protein TrkA
MRYLEDYRGEVPVVDNGRLAGIIWPGEVIERYNTEVFKRDMAGSMATAVSAEPMTTVPALQNTVVAEVYVPPALAGRTIGELRMRQRFGVSVLVIKHHDATGNEHLEAVTGPDQRLEDGDSMLVLGPPEQVRMLELGIIRDHD